MSFANTEIEYDFDSWNWTALRKITRDEWGDVLKSRIEIEVSRIKNELSTMFSANRSSNRTSKPTSLHSMEIFEATCLIVFVITSLLLNISICTVIWRSKLLRKRTTNIFIVNLAISNSLIAIFIMPFSSRAVILQVWDYGQVFCTINGMLSMTFFVASISTLCCISVDRYYAVVKPVKYKNIFTIRRASILLLSSWTISVFCASLPVFGWAEYVYHPGSNHCSPNWKRNCGYYFFMTLIGFGIPLVILILTYWMIFAAIRKHERRFSTWNGIAPSSSYRIPLPKADPAQRPVITVNAISQDAFSHADATELNEQNDFRRRSRSICSGTVSPASVRRNTAQVDFLKIPGQAEIKRQSSMLQFRALSQITTRLRSRMLTIPREYRIAKTGLMLFLVFFVSWGPYMIVNNCSGYYETPVWVYRLAIWLVYCSCILNPMVYAFSSKHIRDAFRVALKCRRERRIADAFQLRKMSEATSTNHVT